MSRTLSPVHLCSRSLALRPGTGSSLVLHFTLPKPLNDANNFTFGEPAFPGHPIFRRRRRFRHPVHGAALFQEISLAPFRVLIHAHSERTFPSSIGDHGAPLRLHLCWFQQLGLPKGKTDTLRELADTLVANLTGISLTFFFFCLPACRGFADLRWFLLLLQLPEISLEGLERRKKNGFVLVMTGPRLWCCWRSVQVSCAKQ